MTFVAADELNAPQPSQHVHCEHGDSSSCGHAGKCLLRAGFAVGKLVSTNDNGNKAGDFGYRACKEGLQGGETGVEGRTLGVRCEWN